MKYAISFTVTAAFGWVLQPVTAHHSAAQFDFSQSVEIEGIVMAFEARNPHIKLILGVSDERGIREIEYEGHSRQWHPNTIIAWRFHAS